MSILIQSCDIELWKVIVLSPKISKNGDDTLKKYEDFKIKIGSL